MGVHIKDAERCTHCHLCQESCNMLSKHGIDIGDIEKLRELRYHCFLCGECSRACPIDIDGKAVVHEMREEGLEVPENSAKVRQNYKGMLAEKADYKFRNYKRATEGSVYFPGCNFPSLFPKTSEYISNLLKKDHGIGTVYDCCGKPVGETGLKNEEERIIAEMNARFEENGITEIITACPNCKDYLTGKVYVPIVDIYTKIRELGYGKTIQEDMMIYLPCPDRDKKEWLASVSEFVDGEIKLAQGINCCGLGGMAKIEEPEIAKEYSESMKTKYNEENVYTYCASCVGNFTRSGKPTKHFLPAILETDEAPDTTKSYLNRVMTKMKK